MTQRHKIHVVVATGNKSSIKINATVRATNAAGLDATVDRHDARSDIDAQPEGREMGQRGAENRAMTLHKLYPNAYVVGMEDYLAYDDDQPVNRTAVTVIAPSGLSYDDLSMPILFDPRDVAAARARGFGTTTVGDMLAERIGSDRADPHGPMSGHAVNREEVHTRVLTRVFKRIKARLDADLIDLTDGKEAFHELRAGRHMVRLPWGVARTPEGVRLQLAFFDLFGVPALACNANALLAHALAPHVPEGVALVVIPEGKSVIAGAMLANALGVPSVMLRKKDRPMRPTQQRVPYKSVTTDQTQNLHLDADAVRTLEAHRGARVLVFDDVISTGGTVGAVRQLLAGYGMAVSFGFIFTEGDAWKKHLDPAQVVALNALPAPIALPREG